MITVEKSLDDAGAEESKTVVAAFDTFTDAEIARIEEATQAQIELMKAEVEAKGESVLATIPEDYTATYNRVNNLFNAVANAIKGTVSGSVVRVDDVSPVEHSPVVKVHGKNLIVFPYAESNASREGISWVIDETDNGLIINGTAAQNTSFNVSMRAQKKIPLKKGKKYTFSCLSNFTATTGYAFLQSVSNDVTTNTVSVRSGSATFTATEDGFAVIGVVLLKDSVFENEKILLQLEEGNTATEYTPYVEPATVTVKRCGKNLAYGGSTQETTNSGITFKRTKGSSVFVINGTAEKLYSTVATSSIFLPAGTYTASVYGLNTLSSNEDRCYLWDSQNEKVITNYVMDNKPKTFTINEPKMARIEIVFGIGSTYSNKTVRLQLEHGNTATEYVECEDFTEHTPSAAGTVEGITSLSPTMTLLTDTDGITIECEYNKDTNKVIEKLTNAVAALGGAV